MSDITNHTPCPPQKVTP